MSSCKCQLGFCSSPQRYLEVSRNDRHGVHTFKRSCVASQVTMIYSSSYIECSPLGSLSTQPLRQLGLSRKHEHLAVAELLMMASTTVWVFFRCTAKCCCTTPASVSLLLLSTAHVFLNVTTDRRNSSNCTSITKSWTQHLQQPLHQQMARLSLVNFLPI